MRVVLDEARCVGHGRCYALAPEVFDADDLGHCVLRYPGRVPDEHADAARIGVANCPEDALAIEPD
jgi:ferredoxin